MQLYFIRHAQSNNNLLFIQTGESKGRNEDPELSRLGQEQARRLAAFYAALPVGKELGPEERGEQVGFTHLYCSLMVRTIQTASVVAQKLDMPLQALSDLHEGGGIFLADPDSGELVGLPGNDHSYFNTNFPELILPDFPAGGWWNRPFETREQRVQRANRLLAELLARHGGSDDRIALVSHGGFYNYLMGAILDIPSPIQVGEENPKARTWLSLNNTAISRVDFLESEVRLVYHNRLDFLPSHLVT